MASFVITSAVVTVNSVDLSDHISSVELSDEFDLKDFTNFGSSGIVERKAGLNDGDIKINFFQDYASSKVDATLWAARGTAITVTVKPTSASTSATNPQYSASFIVSDNKPVAGKVGDAAEVSVTWKKTGALSRATS